MLPLRLLLSIIPPLINELDCAPIALFLSETATFTMAPQVRSWQEMALVSEEFDESTGEFLYTSFAIVDDDTVYFGRLNTPKHDISFQQLTSALSPIPDEEIFPEWPSSDTKLTQAPEVLPTNVYIKRPNLPLYDLFKEHNVLHLIPRGLMDEIHAMEMLLSTSIPTSSVTSAARYGGAASLVSSSTDIRTT